MVLLETLGNNKSSDGESVKRQTVVNRNQFVGCSFACFLTLSVSLSMVLLGMLKGSGFGVLRSD